MHRTIVRTIAFGICTSLIMSSAANANNGKGKGRGHGKNETKNIIMMIPDGCDASIQTLARWVKGKGVKEKKLTVDRLDRGAVKCHMANSVIPGSAAAATAFACGHKTTARFLGVGPRTEDLLSTANSKVDPYAPIASVLEAAKKKGKSVGLVSTSRITHATPAAYYSHVHDRGMDNEIMEQLVYQNVDVVFGGGARHLIPKGETYTTTFGDTWSGKRTDGENLMDILAARGVQFIDNIKDMEAATSMPVMGLFDDSHMDPDLDRDELHPTQPSLWKMTRKAIELLSQDPDGFLLMVEGSQVDWAGHANDPAYMTYDFLAFDQAVKQAYKFAQDNDETLLMVFPDHNTGAISIGQQLTDFAPSYTATTVQHLIDPIIDAEMTWQGLLGRIATPTTAADVRDAFVMYGGEYWNGMTDEVAQYVADQLNEKGAYGAYYPVSEYVSSNATVYGWTTHGHLGGDVPIWSHGPNAPQGTIDNTELADIAAKSMRTNLHALSKKLYVDVKKVFADAEIDDSVDGNATVTIGDAVLYESKDIITIAGTDYQLGSIAVHAPMINTFFIPKEAVKMIN